MVGGAGRAATYAGWPRRCTTTSSRPRATCVPTWPRLIVEGVDAGALRGLVSGSGPTCVFLCESGDHARSVAGALAAADDQRVVLVAHGPVAGAHVVAG